MKLTAEQELVVGLDEGCHLVLAPPGSGKTELLSQRIVRALEAGVRPEKMLCATFTNRAAFEMRDRIVSVAGEKALPEVGNLHHFCHRFLCSVGRLDPTKHVLDEMQQLEFVKEVTDVMRTELRDGCSADLKRTQGVTVIATIKGMCEPLRIRLAETVRSFFAGYEEKGKSPYPDILTAVQIVHQRKCGIPTCYLRSMPPSLYELASDNVVGALEIAYAGLKRKFRSVDFDDLVNETYLFLAHQPLDEERKYDWVQVDEVQDLNPLQWRIVKCLTSQKAVSVYFGDIEQSIFSFLGASSFRFASETSDCTRHYFKTNFRATPLLLEILMRYSIDVLRSEWDFLPAPADLSREDGEVRVLQENQPAAVLSHIRRLLEKGMAENVAILVRDNVSADFYEGYVRRLGVRYIKVSGFDLFSYAPMRDFLAFVSLFTGGTSRVSWASLVRRFATGVPTRTRARYFVRNLFASGFDPRTLLAEENPCGLIPRNWSRRARWVWGNRRTLASLRAVLKPAYDTLVREMEKPLSFRRLFDTFAALALGERPLYSNRELGPELRLRKEVLDAIPYEEMRKHAFERIEIFLRYADVIYREEKRPMRQVLSEDGPRLAKLKEADLIAGDEKIVISTIHKAKGRQFDAVVIPDVASVLQSSNNDADLDGDEPYRLLYVAMSRAKRHLALFGVGEKAVCKSFSESLATAPDGYYRGRQNAAPTDDASPAPDADWLAAWERLAAFNGLCQCPMDEVKAAFASLSKPIVRMALKVLRYCADRTLVREECLARLGTEFADTAIGCLADIGCWDDATCEAVAKAGYTANANRIRCAALAYFRHGLFENERISRGSSPTGNVWRRPQANGCVEDKCRRAIEGFLYAEAGPIRHEAARILEERGVTTFAKLVTGARKDFERLATLRASEHEDIIRTILAVRQHPDYESSLRNVLRLRSQQN